MGVKINTENHKLINGQIFITTALASTLSCSMEQLINKEVSSVDDKLGRVWLWEGAIGI